MLNFTQVKKVLALTKSVAKVMQIATDHKEVESVNVQLLNDLAFVQVYSNDTVQQVLLSANETYDDVSLWDMVEQAVLAAKVGF